MRELIILFHLTLIVGLCPGQPNIQKSFEGLYTIEISKDASRKLTESISFDKTLSEIINKRYRELDRNDPLFREECEGEFIKLVKTKIDKVQRELYIISYNPSCCCSYGFSIYKADHPDKAIGHINTDKLIIPVTAFYIPKEDAGEILL